AETADLMTRLASLTPQQVRVLMMLSEGLLNKQIAYELDVSEATVKAHVSAILQKLGVESRTQAVIAASKIELGQWPQPTPPSHGPASWGRAGGWGRRPDGAMVCSIICPGENARGTVTLISARVSWCARVQGRGRTAGGGIGDAWRGIRDPNAEARCV